MSGPVQSRFEDAYQARRDGHLATCRRLFIAYVRRSAIAGEESSLAEALCGLADVERVIGNCDAARQHYSGAANLYRRVGPEDRLAEALRMEGELLLCAGKPEESEPLYFEAETIYRRRPTTWVAELAATLRARATVNVALGHNDLAKQLRLEASNLPLTFN